MGEGEQEGEQERGRGEERRTYLAGIWRVSVDIASSQKEWKVMGRDRVSKTAPKLDRVFIPVRKKEASDRRAAYVPGAKRPSPCYLLTRRSGSDQSLSCRNQMRTHWLNSVIFREVRRAHYDWG